MNPVSGYSVKPVEGLPEVRPEFDLGGAIATIGQPRSGEVVAISQKVVSKAEGRVVKLAGVQPGTRAEELARELGKDPRVVEMILAEAVEIVRSDAERGILITATRHGFVCANSGIDSSNLEGEDEILLLPADPDESARRIRREIEGATGQRPAVLISDSFGRAWRIGQAEVAIGCAGLVVIDDWRGRVDSSGRLLAATCIAAADQLAAAADLARDKTSRTPAVVVSGCGRFVTEEDGPGCLSQLRAKHEDLFR